MFSVEIFAWSKTTIIAMYVHKCFSFYLCPTYFVTLKFAASVIALRMLPSSADI